jgi:hypothetical protein
MLLGVRAGKLRSTTCPPGEDCAPRPVSPVIPTSFPYVRPVRTLAWLVPVSVLLSAHSVGGAAVPQGAPRGIQPPPAGRGGQPEGRTSDGGGPTGRQAGRRCHHGPDRPLGMWTRAIGASGWTWPSRSAHPGRLRPPSGPPPRRFDAAGCDPKPSRIRLACRSSPSSRHRAPGRSRPRRGWPGRPQQQRRASHHVLIPYRTRWSQRRPAHWDSRSRRLVG